MGFWIFITEPGGIILEYFGAKPLVIQQITLYKGWNLVGFPSLSYHNRTSGLNDTEFGNHIDLIQWYDSATNTWFSLSKNDYFRKGVGYWIHSKGTKIWNVPP
jgi:hypothetical protein